MKWSVCYFYFCSVFVFADINEDLTKNVTLSIESSTGIKEKRAEKRSSSIHPIPSSSSLLLKDEDVSAMERIQVPIIYHTAIGGKPNPYSFKTDLNPHSYILNSNINSFRKPVITNHRHQNLLNNPGPQVFPAQNTYPPVIQHNSFSSYSAQPFSPSHYTPSPQASSSTNPIPKHPDLLYYQNFDKLCPASKPYPVYIEKKVPITIEKRVPYPVKVPYPVHHYHYDNVEHRNINAEDLKDSPPPSSKESDKEPPPKVGGLFTGGDKGGYKGDTKEEMYDSYDENNGGEREGNDEEYYDNYEKSSSREIPRSVPRNVKPYDRINARNNDGSNIKNNNKNNSNNNNNNKRNIGRHNAQQNTNITSNRRVRAERRIERDDTSTKKGDLKKEDNPATEKLIPLTTTVIGLKTNNENKNKDNKKNN